MTKKRVLVIPIITVVLLIGALGGYILYLDSLVFSPLIWTANNSSLELSYVSGKDSKVLRVFDEYVELPKHEWVLVYPKGILGEFRAKRAPKPELLFQEAHVITSNKSLVGLVKFYENATELQQSEIRGTLSSLCERDQANLRAIKELIAEDKYPWLREMIAKKN